MGMKQDKLEELAEGPMQPILDSMWGELTVLGFLGLITFIVQKIGVLSRLSCHMFGDADKIPETLETIHMLLFLVMVTFISEVVMLVALGRRIMKKWRILEEMTDERHEEIEIFTEWLDHAHSERNWDCGLYMLSSSCSTRERIEYMLLRKQFISQHDACGDDFDFADYLAIVLGEEMGEIVEVRLTTWMGLEVLFLAFYFYFTLPDPAIVAGVMAVAFALFLFLLFVKAKLNQIHSMLTPKPASGSTFDPQETDPLVWLETVQPAFVQQPLKHRSWLGKFFLGEPPNKHERLFWFDRHGPKVIFVIVQFSLLLISIYTAIMSFYISQVIVGFDVHVVAKIFIFLAGYVPIILVFFWLMPIIVARYIEVSNIEMLKRDAVVKDVARALKTSKALRAMRMLHVIAFTQLHQERVARASGGLVPSDGELTINGEPSGASSSAITGPLGKAKLDPESKAILEDVVAHHHLSAARETELREMFELYDEDGSGTLDVDELGRLMVKLGNPIDSKLLEAMVDAVDMDGNMELDADEYVSLLSAYEAICDLEPEISVKLLFNMLDADGSGSISLGELRRALNGMGDTFSFKEVEEILRDMDRDGDGEIDLDEFIEQMETYASLE